MGWMNSIGNRMSNYVSFNRKRPTETTLKDGGEESKELEDDKHRNSSTSEGRKGTESDDHDEKSSQIDEEDGEDEYYYGPDTSSLSAFLLSFLTYPSADEQHIKDDELSIDENDEIEVEELENRNDHRSTSVSRNDDSLVNRRSKSMLSRWVPTFSVWRTKKVDEPSSPKAYSPSSFDDKYSPASTPQSSPLINGQSQDFSFHKNGNGFYNSDEPISPLRLPVMSDESIILNDRWRSVICSALPALAIGREWVLLYSTSKHGISLHTLYRRSKFLPGPSLVVVNDKDGVIFGGLSSGPLIASTRRKYQGNNESFVFSDVSGLPVLFRSTGANRYFVLCMNESLSFGGGGHFAFSLDEELLNGTSGHCETFGNPCLSSSEEFVIKHVELWGFAHVSRYTPKGSVWHEPDPNLSIHSL